MIKYKKMLKPQISNKQNNWPLTFIKFNTLMFLPNFPAWCQKNPVYINENCCNLCEKPLSEKEITPDGRCEDLRVDCLHLVKKRYCILSPRFSKEFCSKVCFGVVMLSEFFTCLT